MPDQDLQQQREEFEALEAIFAEDFCQFQEADLLSCQVSYLLHCKVSVWQTCSYQLSHCARRLLFRVRQGKGSCFTLSCQQIIRLQAPLLFACCQTIFQNSQLLGQQASSAVSSHQVSGPAGLFPLLRELHMLPQGSHTHNKACRIQKQAASSAWQPV